MDEKEKSASQSDNPVSSEPIIDPLAHIRNKIEATYAEDLADEPVEEIHESTKPSEEKFESVEEDDEEDIIVEEASNEIPPSIIHAPEEAEISDNVIEVNELSDKVDDSESSAPSEENSEPTPKKTKSKKDAKDLPPPAPIIIKRIKKKSGGGHGGAWKIAFADFVTAMMAFFLLMWLLAALNTSQKRGLAEYFKQPIKVALFGGDSMGNRSKPIKGGGADIKERDGQVSADAKPTIIQKITSTPQQETAEIKKLKILKDAISESMQNDPSLLGQKKQLMMDITKNGLKIQLIDNQNRPMFDMGKDDVNPTVQAELSKIAEVLKNTNNKISIQGHTDANPYFNPLELKVSNWELSTQRANAARRALVKAGLDENKIMRVTGFASTILLDKKNPLNPQNRRITIIVMKKEAEDNLLADE